MARPYAEPRGTGEYRWRVRWPLPPDKDGVVHWGSASAFATEEAALEHGYEQVIAIKNGTWIDPRKGATPFGEFARAWLPRHQRAVRTDEHRRYLLASVIEPRWSRTPLGEIYWDDVREWANSLTIARSTADHAVNFMSMILTSAVDLKMIPANPLLGRSRHNGVKKPNNTPPKVIVYPTPAQASEIAARMTCMPGLMLIFQMWTGLRFAELAAIHRTHSLQRRTDTVGGQPWTRLVVVVGPDDGALEPVMIAELDADGNEIVRRQMRPGPPKNGFSVRDVDLPPFLEDLAAAFLKTQPYDHFFATGRGGFVHVGTYDEQIQRATDGRPEWSSARGKRHYPAAPPILPGLSSHGLRHGHATVMVEAGLPEVIRRRILGQRVPGIAGVYEHPTAAMRKGRVDALEELWWTPGVADVYLAGPHAVRFERRERDPRA